MCAAGFVLLDWRNQDGSYRYLFVHQSRVTAYYQHRMQGVLIPDILMGWSYWADELTDEQVNSLVDKRFKT